MLRSDRGVVETGGDRMRLRDLAELVLQHHRARTVQHSERAAGEPRSMIAGSRPAASRFYADQPDRRMLHHLMEETDRVRSPADARHSSVRQPVDLLPELQE